MTLIFSDHLITLLVSWPFEEKDLSKIADQPSKVISWSIASGRREHDFNCEIRRRILKLEHRNIRI